MKRILKHPLFIRFVSVLIYLYLRFAFLTQRWHIEGWENAEKALSSKEPSILAFWHGRMGLLPNFAPFPKNCLALVSRHEDGEFVAQTLARFGFQLIRGSSNRKNSKKVRGGSTAIKEILRGLKAGGTLCVTPDGPRGPRMHVTGAISGIAAKTNTAIYPITFSCTRAKVFRSWDSFMLPVPFGKAYFICGQTIQPAKNQEKETLEKARKKLENQLNTITEKADTLAGRTPIKPANVKHKP
jgi:hypothetical protein